MTQKRTIRGLQALAATAIALALVGCGAPRSTPAGPAAPPSALSRVLEERPAGGFGTTAWGLDFHRLILVTGLETSFANVTAEIPPAEPRPDAGPPTRFAQAGFDARVVPRSELEAILTALAIHPRIDSTWMGQVLEWTPAAAGERLGRPQLVRLEEGAAATEFASGQFRLLLRAFVVAEEQEPRLRIEVVPQFHQSSDTLGLPDLRARTLSGLLLPEYRAAFELDADSVLLLTLSRPALSEGEEAESTAPAGPGAEDATAIRTLAEELFESRDGNRRLLLVLAPRLPADRGDSTAAGDGSDVE